MLCAEEGETKSRGWGEKVDDPAPVRIKVLILLPICQDSSSFRGLSAPSHLKVNKLI